jgi:nucleoside-diphosphate-sugar epimerase
MKKILCTGGTGFVGYWMLRTQPDDFEVVYQNSDNYFYGNWESAFFTPWDYIIHLAPIGVSSVLKYAQRNNTKVLFASSGVIYEGVGGYADNKRHWEHECLASGVDVVIARLFTFVGGHLKNKFAITNFVDDAIHGRPIQIQGNGKAIRSYLYGYDLGEWMWKLIMEGRGTYDVGSSVPYTLYEVAEMVASIVPSEIEVLNKPDVPNTIYLPNTKRVKEMGCKEITGLQVALERTIEDERNMPNM